MSEQKPPKTLPLDKLGKVKKALGATTVEEIDAKGPAALDGVILEATKSIELATEERDENEHYIKAKQRVNDFNSGLNDVKKRQKAKIAYARHLLAEKGLS